MSTIHEHSTNAGVATVPELRRHLHYGHDALVGDVRRESMDGLIERHRQAHAGDEAMVRGARLGEAFADAGRTIPEGPDPRALTGQAVESAHPGGAASASDPAGPSGPLDPAAQMAKAFVEAVRRLGNPEISPAAVETVLAEDLRKALESYR